MWQHWHNHFTWKLTHLLYLKTGRLVCLVYFFDITASLGSLYGNSKVGMITKMRSNDTVHTSIKQCAVSRYMTQFLSYHKAFPPRLWNNDTCHLLNWILHKVLIDSGKHKVTHSLNFRDWFDHNRFTSTYHMNLPQTWSSLLTAKSITLIAILSQCYIHT